MPLISHFQTLHFRTKLNKAKQKGNLLTIFLLITFGGVIGVIKFKKMIANNCTIAHEMHTCFAWGDFVFVFPCSEAALASVTKRFKA